MDAIKQYILYPELNEQVYTIQKNSHILSARIDENSDNIIVDILVDMDNDEFAEKHFLVFTPDSSINDDLKAQFVNTVIDKNQNVYYVFEKTR